MSQKDLKKLWGLSAGRCSHPDCNYECVNALKSDNKTVIGEMAHIIAQSTDGPRGTNLKGEDTYENLILLCPTHHREIDKSPEGTFTVSDLHEWKNNHENKVKLALESDVFTSIKYVASRIAKILTQNYIIWKNYGPESDEAQNNPLSNAYQIWELKKLCFQ